MTPLDRDSLYQRTLDGLKNPFEHKAITNLKNLDKRVTFDEYPKFFNEDQIPKSQNN